MENSVQISRKTIYSLAMTDFKIYTDNLTYLENTLKTPLEKMNMILGSKDQDELLASYIENSVLTEFYKAEKYISRVEHEIVKYKRKLKYFLYSNPQESEEFDMFLENLYKLIGEKREFVANQIEKCLNYIDKFHQIDSE